MWRKSVGEGEGEGAMGLKATEEGSAGIEEVKECLGAFVISSEALNGLLALKNVLEGFVLREECGRNVGRVCWRN